MIIHKNVKQLRKKAAQIMNIYNNAEWHEELRINHPKSMHIISPDNAAGGIICEVYGETFAMVMFAAFKENDRGKGYLKRCVKEATDYFNARKTPLVGVQVNFKEHPAWEKLGFKPSDRLFNFTQVMLRIDGSEFNELTLKAGGKCEDKVTDELIREFREHRDGLYA